MKTESEQRLEDEIKSIMLELINDGVFPLTHKIVIMTPIEGVPFVKKPIS